MRGKALALGFLMLLIPHSFHQQSQRESSVCDYLNGRSLKCGISLGRGLVNSYRFGLDYEILQKFAYFHECNISVQAFRDTCDLCKMLLDGQLDLALLCKLDTAYVEGISKHLSPDGEMLWACVNKSAEQSLIVDGWLAYASGEDREMMELRQLFSSPYNPKRRAEAGIRSRRISPYDKLIKEYAAKIGWDWKMLAALIYTESKFTINNVSAQGAVGLMQILPKTARHYNAGDLIDPEENIRVGTEYIAKVQRKFFNSPEFSRDDREKLVIASFNAGVGHIEECRNLCAEMGLNDKSWEDVAKAMEQNTVFNADETLKYVRTVLENYESFCTICPY